MEALARDVPHPNAVRLALERRREERGLPQANVVTLPEYLQRRDVIVTPHALHSYDRLTEHRTGENPDDDDRDPDPPSPDLRQRAQALRLPGLLAHWDEVANADWLAHLIGWEEDERARRSLERRLRSWARRLQAHGRLRLELAQPLRPRRHRGTDRPAVHDEAANAIIVGPNGLGKSTIARNIAYQALIAGHTVLFANAGQLLGDLAALDSASS